MPPAGNQVDFSVDYSGYNPLSRFRKRRKLLPFTCFCIQSFNLIKTFKKRLATESINIFSRYNRSKSTTWCRYIFDPFPLPALEIKYFHHTEVFSEVVFSSRDGVQPAIHKFHTHMVTRSWHGRQFMPLIIREAEISKVSSNFFFLVNSTTVPDGCITNSYATCAARKRHIRTFSPAAGGNIINKQAVYRFPVCEHQPSESDAYRIETTNNINLAISCYHSRVINIRRKIW